jgi:hypothetical protein
MSSREQRPISYQIIPTDRGNVLGVRSENILEIEGENMFEVLDNSNTPEHPFFYRHHNSSRNAQIAQRRNRSDIYNLLTDNAIMSSAPNRLIEYLLDRKIEFLWQLRDLSEQKTPSFWRTSKSRRFLLNILVDLASQMESK